MIRPVNILRYLPGDSNNTGGMALSEGLLTSEQKIKRKFCGEPLAGRNRLQTARHCVWGKNRFH